MNTISPRDLVAQLEHQHRILDRAAGSLLTWALTAQEKDPDARRMFVEFFRDWCFGHHHRLEEEVLFKALVEQAEVPHDRGPLQVLRLEHQRQLASVDTLGQALPGTPTTAVVRAFVHSFWEHLDKERSVEFPESGRRLGRHGVSALEVPFGLVEPPTAVLELLDRHPPHDDPTVVRGDGCIMCSAFAEECHGLESEWWSVWEWQHYRSLDEG